MCDVVGDKSERCSEAMATLHYIFNNKNAIAILQEKFNNILHINPNEKGAWVVSITEEECGELCKTKEIEDKLLKGIPFTELLSNSFFGLDWSKLCLFVKEQDLIEFKTRIVGHVDKAKEEEGNFAVVLSMAPVARMILSNHWESIEAMINMYEKENSIVVIAAVMNHNAAEKYHARSMFSRLKAPTSFDDHGVWQYGYLVSMLTKHMLNTMFRCNSLNERKDRFSAPKLTLDIVEDKMRDAFVNVIQANESLLPVSPQSLKAVVLSKDITCTCFACGKKGAKAKCLGCSVCRYCDAKCQERHWKSARGAYRLAHKNECQLLRSFAIVMAQTPDNIEGDMFEFITLQAQKSVSYFCERVNEKYEEEQISKQ